MTSRWWARVGHGTHFIGHNQPPALGTFT